MLNKNTMKKWTWKEYTIAALAVFLAAAIVINIVSVLKMKKAESAIPEVTPIGEPVEVEVSPEITLSASLIAEKLKDVGELVSTRYTYTYYDEYEKSHTLGGHAIPGTKDRYLYIYNGTICAGADLSQIKIAVDNDDKVITLDVQEVKQISHNVDYDSFRVFELKNSIFTSTSLDEFADLQIHMQEIAEEWVWTDEFREEVRDNAKIAIKEMLELSGLTDGYIIKYA